jgi:hypothetical protein
MRQPRALGVLVVVTIILKTNLTHLCLCLGGLVKSSYKVDVTNYFSVGCKNKNNRMAIRQTIVDWLESHVGSVDKRFADGTPTAGDGWKFISKTEIDSIECAGVGLGQVTFGQTYKEKLYLVFDDETQAMHFKLSWSDRL